MGLKTLRRAHVALPITAVQNEYSMLWRGPEKDVIPTCEELGIGFVPWSPVGQGFLTGAFDTNTRFDEKNDFRAGFPRFMTPAGLASNRGAGHPRPLPTFLGAAPSALRGAASRVTIVAWPVSMLRSRSLSSSSPGSLDAGWA